MKRPPLELVYGEIAAAFRALRVEAKTEPSLTDFVVPFIAKRIAKVLSDIDPDFDEPRFLYLSSLPY